MKLDHFKLVGDYDSIFKISELIDKEEWNQNLVESLISYYLLNDDYKFICKKAILNRISDENINLKIRAFCSAMSSNIPAIDLIISLMIEEESYDDELVYILNSYLFSSFLVC